MVCQPVPCDRISSRGYCECRLLQFMPILDKIFLTGSQHVRDLAPPYWDTCLKGEIVRDEQTWKCQYRPDAPNSAIAGRYPSFRGRFIPANVKPPKPVRTTPEPQYTQIAQNLRMQGTTVLGLVVDTDGHPRDIQIISPVGLGLDDQAVRAVEQWRFKPATRDGVPIAVQIDVGVNFRLLPYQK